MKSRVICDGNPPFFKFSPTSSFYIIIIGSLPVNSYMKIFVQSLTSFVSHAGNPYQILMGPM